MRHLLSLLNLLFSFSSHQPFKLGPNLPRLCGMIHLVAIL